MQHVQVYKNRDSAPDLFSSEAETNNFLISCTSSLLNSEFNVNRWIKYAKKFSEKKQLLKFILTSAIMPYQLMHF